MRFDLIAVALLLVSLSALLIPTVAVAQNDDPFGGDPFSNKGAGSDPFAPSRRQTAPQDKSRNQGIIERAKQAMAAGKRPIKVQPGETKAGEAKIKAALDDETTFTFIETPLSEAMQSLSAAHNIPIIIDKRALEELGLSSDVPLSISLNNVSLRSFLRLALRDLECTYVIKDEVLQITTVAAAEENLVLEMYVLPQNLAMKSDQVVKVLCSTVVPDTWETLGGNSTAYALDHVLVISTTSDVQNQVETFLSKLVAKYGKPDNVRSANQ